MLKTIKERSSIRKYKKEALKKEEIEAVVEAGLRAPTARNEQEINFTVVSTNNVIVKEIQNDLNPDADHSFYYDAPTLIFLSGKDDFSWSQVDAGIAVENMHLSAKEMGLGSLIIGCIRTLMNSEKKEYYAKKLGFKEGYSFIVSIAIGYPDTDKPQHNYSKENNVNYID
ncbi:MAG: nitroreductase [Erysipelotrichaceae bacterium]|nr:nitroreductase [Erysipelotrichaceae bacterium]